MPFGAVVLFSKREPSGGQANDSGSFVSWYAMGELASSKE
jgi:hypothetical protein